MITQQEFETILADTTKRIEGNLAWRDDEDHSPAQQFRAAVLSDDRHPLDILGRWNPKAEKLSFVLLYRGLGRIYGLDIGVGHRNPTRERIESPHKHAWTDEFKDKRAYVPPDITAPWDEPVQVWLQFCAEARILHAGTLYHPNWQEDLL